MRAHTGVLAITRLQSSLNIPRATPHGWIIERLGWEYDPKELMVFAATSESVRLCARRLETIAFLLFCFSAPLIAQTLDPVSGSLQDVAGQIALPIDLSFEQQIQVGTQGNSSVGNPFTYGHGIQLRPWLHYDGIPNFTLTGSVGYILYFSVPATSYYKHPEWRDTLMGTLKETLPGGSLYEQVRGELLNFHDSGGTVQHLPRVRIRFGQNLFLGEGRPKIARPYIGFYEEGIFQFPRPSYSHVTFTSARFFAGAGFTLGMQAQLLLGFKAEADVSSSGSTVTLFYGPAFSIEYNFLRDHPLHENHRRTTAFKDF